jgi:nucleoside-diphosphate-sugar epimerase
VGPGWTPINPAANFNLEIFAHLAAEREVLLPNLGMETLNHVHASDVASAFAQAIARRSAAIGESFHVVSAAALTLRGYAERIAAWFGKEPNLRFLPWEEWRTHHSEKDARITWDHIARSPNCSIAKAQELLSWKPKYDSLRAVQESLEWLIASGALP